MRADRCGCERRERLVGSSARGDPQAVKQEDFQAISDWSKKWHVARLVIGLPLTLEGEIGPQARRVRRYGATLSKTLAIPIDFEMSGTVPLMRLESCAIREDSKKAT